MSRPLRPHPIAAHVLVCTGPRCAERGARRLFHGVWSAYEEQRIAYYRTGGHVRLTETGCLGACDHGPNVAVYLTEPDGRLREEWHAAVTLDDVVTIGRQCNSHPCDQPGNTRREGHDA